MTSDPDQDLLDQRHRQRRLLAAAPQKLRPTPTATRPRPSRDAERLLRNAADVLIKGPAGEFLEGTVIAAAARAAYDALATVEISYHNCSATPIGESLLQLRRAPDGPDRPNTDLGEALISLIGALAAADALAEDAPSPES
jgi:hypothetical protein